MRDIPHHLIKDAIYVVNYLVYRDPEEQKKFIYLAVKEDDMPAYEEALKSQNFIAEDYGIILEEGDNEASDAIKQRMELIYQCDHSNI